MDEVLRVSNVYFSYDRMPVLKNISFSVCEKDFLGIIGPNASGKTTLFKVITKIFTQESGDIVLFEKNINSYSQKDIAKIIAVIPQVLEIFFPFTVYEFVSMGRYMHRQNKSNTGDKIIENVLKEMDVYELRDKDVKKLSGGERQRVIIAQALAQEPKLILLDEPVTHLDIKYQFEILNLLKKQNENGLTVLVILHDLNLAGGYCNRLVLLSEGEKVADNVPEGVLKAEILKEVYKTEVVITKNPVTQKPYVMTVSR